VKAIAAAVAAAVGLPVLVGATVLRGPSDPTVIVGYTGETLSTPPTAPATVLTEPPSTLPPPDLGRPPLPSRGPPSG
jgi:hypothetical protein